MSTKQLLNFNLSHLQENYQMYPIQQFKVILRITLLQVSDKHESALKFTLFMKQASNRLRFFSCQLQPSYSYIHVLLFMTLKCLTGRMPGNSHANHSTRSKQAYHVKFTKPEHSTIQVSQQPEDLIYNRKYKECAVHSLLSY